MTQRTRPRHADAPSTFGGRLRQERERRKISIASIAENTKILGALLEGLENDDVSRWPTGFYRRAFIRAYATAIGLDAEPVVREFGELYPDPDAAASLPSVAVASPDTARDGKLSALRIMAPESGTWFSPGPLVRDARLRCFAVAVDAFVLCVMGLGLFAVFGSFWAPLTLAMGAYYFGSILIFGNTPGVCLFAAHPAPNASQDAEAKPASSIAYALGRILRRSHWRAADASNFG
jgi:transcriptional regulator with XRE-family HTH domain